MGKNLYQPNLGHYNEITCFSSTSHRITHEGEAGYLIIAQAIAINCRMSI